MMDCQKPLTKMEKIVLELIEKGMTNKEIAGHLCISVKTVETHVGNILRAFEVHDRKKLMARAKIGEITDLSSGD